MTPLTLTLYCTAAEQLASGGEDHPSLAEHVTDHVYSPTTDFRTLCLSLFSLVLLAVTVERLSV